MHAFEDRENRLCDRLIFLIALPWLIRFQSNSMVHSACMMVMRRVYDVDDEIVDPPQIPNLQLVENDRTVRRQLGQ